MNRLRDQSSPYLRQHADNPVEWQPWDAEALALARARNKPILLSIGYAASHQCHVMTRESFESTQVASILNENFTCILVDREERPDIDRLYQTAHGLLNRRPGGWPLTMFLDPQDQLPFFGGTYFPPQPKPSAPGFREVLKGITRMYAAPNHRLAEFKQNFRTALGQVLGGSAPGELDGSLVDRACGQIDASFDAEHGGFSEAPKYPHPPGLELLLDAAHFADDEAKAMRARYLLDFTLQAVAAGGLYDHLGGGFHRDTVDAAWNMPHFEKMLGDNAQLLSLFARRAAATGQARFAEVAHRTADWLLREMQHDHGAFAGSLDADADGAEGRYYLWPKTALQGVLGERFDDLAPRLGFADKPPSAAGWQLRLAPPTPGEDALAAATSMDGDLEAVRAELFAARAARLRPRRDDKILTGWNALAIRGLVDAATCLNRPDCLVAASQTADFLRAHHWQGERLLAGSHAGQAGGPGFLDDYSLLLDALLALLAARWRESDFQFAHAVADALLARFSDATHGGFFFTSDEHENLLERSKIFSDDACPSGNGTAARALRTLGLLTGDARYLEAATRTLHAGMTDAGRGPSANATVVRALLEHQRAAPVVVLRTDSETAAQPWRNAVREQGKARVPCFVVPPAVALDASRNAAAGVAVSGFVCRGAVAEPALAESGGLSVALG